MKDPGGREVTPLGKKDLLRNEKEAIPSLEGKGDDCATKHSQKGKGSRVGLSQDYGFLV